MNGSRTLRFATGAVIGPGLVLFVHAIGSKPAHVDEAILLALCLAPTAITWHFADWLERIERTMRIQFMPPEPSVLLRLRAGVACSLLTLAWALFGALAAPMLGFDLRIVAVVLGPVIVGLAFAGKSIDSAVERVLVLAEAA